MKLSLFTALVATLLAISGCGHRDVNQSPSAEHDATQAKIEKGPHNGRLLRDGNLAVELAIFEDGIPPEYRAWLYRDGQLLPPSAGQLQVVLQRLGKVTDTHAFTAQDDFLRGTAEVYEPHSFAVEVTAQIDGKALHWQFDSYEGRTTIAAAIASQSGIRVLPASPGIIRDEHEVQGLLTLVEGRYARVMARFPGPIRAVSVAVGDTVKAGQPLATVESNVSLSNYVVASPLSGTVLARNANIGELAGDQPLFEIADLSTLWVDLHVFGSDATHIAAGAAVVVTRLSDDLNIATRIDRVLPSTATASQSTVARATLHNDDGHWRPGTAVRARITVSEERVALAVPLAALQRFRDWDVVFVRDGDDYEIRPLQLGRRDGVNVEVLDGLKPGDPVVVEQSYLVKADIEKSGASHDH